MAANYWASTQKQFWHFQPEELADMRADLAKHNARVLEQHPYPDRRHMLVFMKDRLLQLRQRLAIRQQCVATAMTYIQRYFLFAPMQNVNLYLLAATAFYLASKTEESPHHIRSVSSEARQLWPEFVPNDVSRLGEMEFCLISEMHSQLIVWHPYRTLMTLKEKHDLSLTNEELVLAWSIVNDTYMTDLPLTCPPFLISITAIFLAIIFVPNKSTLNIQNVTLDLKTQQDLIGFSGLGGRPGLGKAYGSVADAVADVQNGANGVDEDGQLNDSMSVKKKTLVAAKTSEKMQRVIRFLVESDIDVQKMVLATQEIISLYEVWESYNDKTVKEAVSRCLKLRGLDH